MARVGYARVSTQDQELDAQLTALEDAGCGRIFHEKASGMKPDRPELLAALDYLRDGDDLVIYSLSRLGRSVVHLIQTVVELEERGVGLVSLSEPIDTRSQEMTATGKFTLYLFVILAGLERDLTAERTTATLAAKRAAGIRGGRPPALPPQAVEQAREMLAKGQAVALVAEAFKVSESTIRRLQTA